ncbi:MAG: GMP reductase [Chloroflexi bacterium]|nr:GMP reductase [Chloroflexota bacterium]
MFDFNNKKINFDDVLIYPKASRYNSRKEIILDSKINFPKSRVSWTGIPLMASNMDFVGTFSMGFKLQKHYISNAVSKFYTKEEWVQSINEGLNLDYNFLTFGLDEIKTISKYISHITSKTNKVPKFLVFDVPNGYIKKFSDVIEITRKEFPKLGIIAGNVVTAEGVKILIESGADGVKVGIGSGSVCSTTDVTGIGYPQLSAVIECSKEAKRHNAFIVSDGGIKTSADVVKAFAGGAGYVMLGSLFSGHIEGGAPITKIKNKEYRTLYGMSSTQAMNKHYGNVADYRASEGQSILVEDKGTIENTISQILGGIRSACTYIDAKNIGEIYEKSDFILV